METFFTDDFLFSLNALDKPVKEVAVKKISKILLFPKLGKPLHGEPNRFSERFLQYRIVYKIEGSKIIFAKLGKRDDVYRVL